MRYTIENNEGTIIVKIFDDQNQVTCIQNFNPTTGEPFATEDEAKTWAESYIKEFSQDVNDDQTNDNVPILKVRFMKGTEEAKIIDVNTPVSVNVELYFEKDEQKVYAPVNGRYVVPYFKDDVMAGATIIDVTNGQGSGVLTFKESGIYTIKLDKILNAETMKQPSPLPRLSDDVKLIVVEPLETTQTDTTSETSNNASTNTTASNDTSSTNTTDTATKTPA